PNGGTLYVLQRYSNVASYPNDIFVSELTADGDFAAAAHFGGPSAGPRLGNNAPPGSGNGHPTRPVPGTANCSPNGTYNLTSSSAVRDGFVSKLTQTGPLLAAAQAAVAPLVLPLAGAGSQSVSLAANRPAAAVPPDGTAPPTAPTDDPSRCGNPPAWLGPAGPRKRPSALFADRLPR